MKISSALQSKQRVLTILIILSGLMTCSTDSGEVHQYKDTLPPVPSREEVGDLVGNYTVVLPFLGTSGAVRPEVVENLKVLGFGSLLDLRLPNEGVDAVATVANEQGLDFLSLPVGRSIPDESSINAFANEIENTENYPLLVYCGSGNRVGMMWAVYRLRSGESLDKAIQEGKIIGMSDFWIEHLEEYAQSINN